MVACVICQPYALFSGIHTPRPLLQNPLGSIAFLIPRPTVHLGRVAKGLAFENTGREMVAKKVTESCVG